MEKVEEILNACNNELKRLKETIVDLKKEIDERTAIGKRCSFCDKEINNACGQEDIFEMPCSCCDPNRKTPYYYCTKCFIKRLRLSYLKIIIKDMEEISKTKEKQKKQGGKMKMEKEFKTLGERQQK